MKYAFYPGCVSRGGCPELYPAAVKVTKKLGIELVELKDVGCTGAGVLSREVSDPINARTLAKAEVMGLPIMTICSTCQGTIMQANYRLVEDPAYRERIQSGVPGRRRAGVQGHHRRQALPLGPGRGLRTGQAEGASCHSPIRSKVGRILRVLFTSAARCGGPQG